MLNLLILFSHQDTQNQLGNNELGEAPWPKVDGIVESDLVRDFDENLSGLSGLGALDNNNAYNMREVLNLPIFKENFDTGIPTFEYTLRTPTSPATKKNEESLTYLNQGQSYEIR